MVRLQGARLAIGALLARYRRAAWFRAIALVLAVFAFEGWMVHRQLETWHFTGEVLISQPSPSGAWTARLVWRLANDPITGWTQTGDMVELLAEGHPNDHRRVLWVNTTGHPELFPSFAWTAPDVLQITAKNRSIVEILTTQVDDVAVQLRFDPDDPADRLAWLTQTGRIRD